MWVHTYHQQMAIVRMGKRSNNHTVHHCSRSDNAFYPCRPGHAVERILQPTARLLPKWVVTCGLVPHIKYLGTEDSVFLPMHGRCDIPLLGLSSASSAMSSGEFGCATQPSIWG